MKPLKLVLLLTSISLIGFLFYTLYDVHLQEEIERTYIYQHRPFRSFYVKLLEAKEWQLIWNDEFNGGAISSKNWNTVDWIANKNNELQYYSPQNVYQENGLLRIYTEERNTSGKPYTSGAVDTLNKLELLYGRIEIKAKLPKGQGMFPAFWLLPANGDALPEIDMVELLGHEPNKIWMVYHWFNNTGVHERAYSYFEGTDFSEEFNLFALEWFPEKIVWYINNIEVFYYDLHSPSTPLYLNINTAVGGNWPGVPDKTTSFPQYLDIDYVRIYKHNNSR